VLIVPSKVEGFGLPVAEALMVGCRVVCSDIAALREIGGAHCHYVTLGANEEEALASAIRTALQEPPKDPITLPHLSADCLACQYLDFYRQLLGLQLSVSTATRAAACSPTTPEAKSSDVNKPSQAMEQGGLGGCI